MTGPRGALAAGPTAAQATRVEEELAAPEPHLAPLLRRELPRAMDIVARRLLAAGLREGLVAAGPQSVRLPAPWGRIAVTRHGFDRLEPAEPVPGDPVALL